MYSSAGPHYFDGRSPGLPGERLVRNREPFLRLTRGYHSFIRPAPLALQEWQMAHDHHHHRESLRDYFTEQLLNILVVGAFGLVAVWMYRNGMVQYILA